MGKYSNVNADSIINAAQIAKDEISNYDLSETRKNLKNRSVINSSVTIIVDDALNEIINSSDKNGSLNKLKNKLDNLSDAAEYIKKYQEAEKEIQNLEKVLYKEETYYEYSTDSKGKVTRNEFTKTVLDTTVQFKINSLKRNMESYEKKIDSYLS